MAKKQKVLKKSLGLFDILMFGVGGIVGAGIYAIIGEAAGLAGHTLWISFIIAAVVAWLTGLAYAEFVSLYPDAGGSFEYIKQSFGKNPALMLSIIMLMTGVVAPAAIAISFADYLGRLIEFPQWITTIGVIALMALINVIGIQQSSWFNTLATIITLLGLGAVVGFSIPEWSSVELFKMDGSEGVAGLFAGAALVFFSYVGFEDLVKVAEEVEDAKTVMPKGILISGLIVLVIYVLIAISAVAVMPPSELAESKGPLAAVLGKTAGPAWVTGLIVVALFATSKTVLSNIMGASRLIFDVARDSDISWLQRFGKVRKASGTPTLAIIATASITILFSLIGNLKVVATLSNIFVFILFIAVNLALLNHRKNRPEEEAPFRIPLNINNLPVPTMIAIAGLVTLLGFNIYNLL